jgi:hypothetical protein
MVARRTTSRKAIFSPDDIAKGSRWESEISKELAASRLGLLILTPENVEASWLVFEAGALSKTIEKSKVCPLLFGLEATDVKGPLVQFQAAKFEATEIKRVVKMINAELADQALESGVLEQVFEMWWPRLHSEVTRILQRPGNKSGEQSRSERDILEEILALTRSASKRTLVRGGDSISPTAVRDLAAVTLSIAREAAATRSTTLLGLANELYDPVFYIVRRFDEPSLAAELREVRSTLRSLEAEKESAIQQKSDG